MLAIGRNGSGIILSPLESSDIVGILIKYKDAIINPKYVRFTFAVLNKFLIFIFLKKKNAKVSTKDGPRISILTS